MDSRCESGMRRNMSNLPPGINENMIPGNRPEDEAEEAFWEILDHRFIERYGEKAFESIQYIINSHDLDESFLNYINEVRVIAYDHGYANGRTETEEIFAEREREQQEEDDQIDYVNRCMQGWATTGQ